MRHKLLSLYPERRAKFTQHFCLNFVFLVSQFKSPFRNDLLSSVLLINEASTKIKFISMSYTTGVSPFHHQQFARTRRVNRILWVRDKLRCRSLATQPESVLIIKYSNLVLTIYGAQSQLNCLVEVQIPVMEITFNLVLFFTTHEVRTYFDNAYCFNAK